MRASVVIRTLNEERHLNELLEAVHAQDCGDMDVEVVLVDSGSSDRTLEIAERHGCRLERIERSEFSFGRSLNRGCAASAGDGGPRPGGTRYADDPGACDARSPRPS